MAEQAREAAAQARTDAAGEADRLRGELASLASALKTAQRQREEAVTAAAVAQALLHEQESSRLPEHAGPGTGDPAATADVIESARPSSGRSPTPDGSKPGDAPPAGLA